MINSIQPDNHEMRNFLINRKNEIDKEIQYSGGISFGILIIPYQLQQLSGLTLQIGFNLNTIIGDGIELGIGYRI